MKWFKAGSLWLACLLLVLPAIFHSATAQYTLPATQTPNPNAIKIGFGCPFADEWNTEWCDQIVFLMDLHRQLLQSQGVLGAHQVQILPYRDLEISALQAYRASDYFVNTARVQAVIGYVYGSMTVPASFPISHLQLPMCDGTSVGLDFSDKTRFPTFMRTIASLDVMNRATIEYLSHMKWTKNVAYMYDADGTETQRFVDGCAAKGIELSIKVKMSVQYGTTNSSVYEPWIRAIKQQGSFIIVLASVDAHVAPIVTEAKRQGIFGPGYFWITGSYAMDAPGIRNTTGLHFVYPEEKVGPVADELITRWRQTQYYQQRKYDPWAAVLFYGSCLELIMRRFDTVLRQSTDSNPLQSLLSGQYRALLSSPGNYSLGPNSMTPTGPIVLDANGDRLPDITIYHINGQGKYGKRAIWNPSTGFRDFNPVVYPGNVTETPRDVIPIEELATWEAYSSPLGGVLIFLCMLGAAMASVLGAIYVMFASNPIIKRASPRICLVMILGTIIGFATIFTVFGKPTTASCILDAWLLPTSFSLVFGNLITKSYRIYRVFSSTRRIKPMMDSAVVMASLFIWLVQVVILIAWMIIDPPIPRVASPFPGSYYWTCSSASSSLQTGFVSALVGYNAFWLLVGFVMAWVTRALPSEYGEAKWIATSAYFVTFVCLFAVPILSIQVIPMSVKAPFKGLAVFVALTTVNSLMFVPRAYSVAFKKQVGSSSSSRMASMMQSKAGTASQASASVAVHTLQASPTEAPASPSPSEQNLISKAGAGHSSNRKMSATSTVPAVQVAANAPKPAHVFFSRKVGVVDVFEQGIISYDASSLVYAHVVLKKPKGSENSTAAQEHKLLPVESFKDRAGFAWALAKGVGEKRSSHQVLDVAEDAQALTIHFTLTGMQKNGPWAVKFVEQSAYAQWLSWYKQMEHVDV
ncbi:7 transmembrane sweet-taste receptor of 3 GCPR-domain-containing protein [Catenaria anguillulae PL171]|uniref:7 transmembrane sweet-taste receptor of 3 GCPR-domain-containing protein n=1 Tax=Catenaria anguillulae PL171 TaxID=765915 RepID=A0A1Y2I2J1_9FUNG|nr:7 transmembrane sweet-taste receptor of 3 GCPR-domain-containing protein [Catenaria anguillulae PL171]